MILETRNGLLILIACTLFIFLAAGFKNYTNISFTDKSGQKSEFYNSAYSVMNENNNGTENLKIDSNKNKSSLDGSQNIIKPENKSKPFDPNAPFTKLTFRMLRTYIPGKQCPEDLKKLDNQNVEILGFMTPLNALTDMDEFLLCSSPPLSCYCAPPIFINEIIYVKLMNKRTDFKTGAVKIKGQLSINLDVKDEYSDIIYSINASDID